MRRSDGAAQVAHCRRWRSAAHPCCSEALLLTHDSGTGYQLTALGRDLLTAFDPLLRWSVRWMKAVDASVERQARG